MRATKTDKEKQMSRAAVDKGIGRIAVFINDIGNPPIYNPGFGTTTLTLSPLLSMGLSI